MGVIWVPETGLTVRNRDQFGGLFFVFWPFLARSV